MLLVTAAGFFVAVISLCRNVMVGVVNSLSRGFGRGCEQFGWGL